MAVSKERWVVNHSRLGSLSQVVQPGSWKLSIATYVGLCQPSHLEGEDNSLPSLTIFLSVARYISWSINPRYVRNLRSLKPRWPTKVGLGLVLYALTMGASTCLRNSRTTLHPKGLPMSLRCHTLHSKIELQNRWIESFKSQPERCYHMPTYPKGTGLRQLQQLLISGTEWPYLQSNKKRHMRCGMGESPTWAILAV